MNGPTRCLLAPESRSAARFPLCRRSLNAVTENAMVCRYCGDTFEIPSDLGDRRVFQTIHAKNPRTQRATGEVIIMVNGTRVHGCRQEPED
jgi:hypothetical protein